MLETIAYILAIPGAVLTLLLLVTFISHLLDCKAAADRKREIEEAKKRAVPKDWWPHV